jgi:hypothetical protein
MVKDHVWEQQAGYAPDDLACLHCLERRLGRMLRLDDFTTAPVNAGMEYRLRFLHRLGAGTTPHEREAFAALRWTIHLDALNEEAE